ncbi:MAG: hypothetical protein OXG40_06815 [Acidimicrobiaceae bacterium]|nr:hypothetical protein [Acidimicrobiaceae bacterium]MDE0516857.1 hypothetical protein [Acidimicrobiaceae bacterium]MDE0657525.1 hypothetical protein [Acidimicrobiaceae bacterium]
MIYAYPCEIAADESGELVVTFPDVPEAITGGRDGAEALLLAADALSAALAGYVHDQRDIPQPSTASSDQEVIAVPAVITAKLALYSAMRSQNITESDLAGRLGASPSSVRKLTDPDRPSRIGELQKALDAVGCRLVIDVTAA